MTDVAVGLLAALGCGLVGLGVPELIATLPGPAGEVSRRHRLRRWAALAAAAAGGVIGATVGADWALLVLLPLVPVCVALAFVDAHAHLLPTRIIWPALATAVGLGAVAAVMSDDGGAFVRALLAGAAMFAAFHALWWLKPGGLGYGDVRLSALVGYALGYLGWAEVLVGGYGAFVVFIAAAVARALWRRRWASMREPLPFGPYLLLGALVGIVLGGYLASV